jgi:protein arginine kinase activator
MTYDEFLNLGKFGCSNCYSIFSNKIDNILKKINGSNRYLGDKKISEYIDRSENKNIKNEEIEKLKKELKILIRKEEYEKAAIIRDKIKEIERSCNNE